MTREYEPGIYRGTITSWTLGESKEKGTPQFCVTFSVDYHEVGGNQEPVGGGERTIFRPITENTIDYVVRDLRALGYDRNDFDGLDPEGANPFDFGGMQVRVRLKYETYKDKEVERWDFAMATGLQVKKLEQSGVKKLNSIFGTALRKNGPTQISPEVAAPRLRPGQPPVNEYDDTTPF